VKVNNVAIADGDERVLARMMANRLSGGWLRKSVTRQPAN
jgi:hypothetical protein